jgi:hypothetical protein
VLIERLNFSRLLTSVGLLNLRLRLNPEIASMSLCSKSKFVISKFCCRRVWLLLLGMTANPLCVAHRKRTWAGVLLCFFEMSKTAGCSKRVGVSLAFCHSSSTNDWGPKDEYAVTAMPSASASFRRFGCTRYGWCSICRVAGRILA